ncbi:hypothetical protein HU719_002145 [Pseudomonas sp. SWRI107]|uniref:hypothetical protein n=1 Tax=Pseudomonas farsensis TaxID=2745492 RepID=UPI0016480729|nr:hypothetical protein [Pseudomonas farsensis]MBV4530243.1 hypothetical protein [Pseudomonas farsensis]
MSEIHTQASNFLDFVKTGVDHRTGQFTLAIALPMPPANQLCGPSLTLSLAFSTLSSMSNRGYGFGWNLALSEIDLSQDNPRISLGSGEQFAIDLNASTLSGEGQLALPDQKLKTFIVTHQADGDIRVDRKSGESEILHPASPDSARYLLAQLRSAEGRSLYFDWAPFGNDGFILEQVRDEQDTLLAIDVGASTVKINLRPGHAEATSLTLLLSNDRLNSIQLPNVPQPFDIEYGTHPVAGDAQLLLPTVINGPLGGRDTVHWSDADNGHKLPDDAPLKRLPRVLSWTHVSAGKHNEINRGYAWIGEHNFLGYGSDQAFEWKSGRDNLYQVNAQYQYEVVETLSDGAGQALGSVHRVWNRFHLLISETSRNQACETIKQTHYGVDPALTWEQQPAWCQLPHETITTYVDHANDKASRSETTRYAYDEWGNVSEVTHPSGVRETCEYYPAAGAEGCPADALGMVRYLRSKVVIPAPASGDAQALATRYTYTALPSLIVGAPALSVVACEEGVIHASGEVFERTEQTYITTPGPAYAREDKVVTTLNDKATTTDYHYEVKDGALITQTTITGFENDDENRSSSSRAQSLTSGQTLWELSASGACSRYEYDLLGRVVCSISCADSPYQSERRAHYHLADNVAIQALEGRTDNPVMIEEVEVTGQRKRQWLDGDGRVVRIEVEDLDNAPGVFREVALSEYDALGRVTRQTAIDWLDADTSLTQTSTTHYSDWGHSERTVSPDGVTSHTRMDPVTLRSEQWQSAGELTGPRQVVLSNAAGNALEQQDFDSAGRLVRTLKRVRDGLDRVIENRVKVDGMDEIVTQMGYDHYGRVIEKRLPDGTTINWTFAAHSDDHHPEALTVTGGDQ